MQLFDTLLNLLQKWFAELTTLSGGLQLIAAISCFVLALLTHRRWQNYIARFISNFEYKGFVKLLLNGTDRAAFPLSMLLYVITCRFILTQFQLNVAILDVFTPLLLSLAAVRLTVYTLRKAFRPSPALRAWEGLISLSIWIIVALYLVGWLPDIIKAMEEMAVTFGDTKFSLWSLVKLLAAIILFVVFAGWLSTLIENKASKSQYISPSMRVALAKFSKFFLYTLAILIALNSVGIDLTTFAVFSGALGVGIGFGLQRIASNFISGFILLFDRSIKPGDVITIGDRFGWVQALHARYIVVKDREGVEALIPNETLITTEVTNWSYSDRNVRVKIPVQASYNDDPELIMQLLLEAANGQARVLNDPPAVSRLMGFGDNGIDYELRVWINDPENGVANVRSDINLAIWKKFKEHNVTIPFPQRDVHMIKPD